MEESVKRGGVDGGVCYSVVRTSNRRGVDQSAPAHGSPIVKGPPSAADGIGLAIAIVGIGIGIGVVIGSDIPPVPDESARQCTKVVKQQCTKVVKQDDQVRKEALKEFSASGINFMKAFLDLCVSLNKFKESFRQLYASYNAYRKSLGVREHSSWCLDTAATDHVCYDKAMFSTYEAVTDGSKVLMANRATSNIVGIGNVVIETTSGLKLTLENVLHVPDNGKNLISGSQLSKASFTEVFEGNKVVLTKNGRFIGNGYLVNGLFILNATTVYPACRCVHSAGRISPQILT